MSQIIGSRVPRDPETHAIIGAAMEVHRMLGAGFLEPVYQEALHLELTARRIPHEREVAIPIAYKGNVLAVAYRSDFVCFGEVLVELKALRSLAPAHVAQSIHYLVATKHSRGLLLNFGSASLQYKRFAGPRQASINR